MGSAVYYAGIRPPQFDNFAQLEKTASQQELLTLTEHPNGVVRCYAAWALSHDSTVDLVPIVIRHIQDTATVFTQFGCIGSQERVGDFFIELGNDSPYFRKEGYSPGPVYGNYIEQLFLLEKNGVLRYRNLFGNSDYIFKDVQLEEIKPPPVKKHNRIKK